MFVAFFAPPTDISVDVFNVMGKYADVCVSWGPPCRSFPEEMVSVFKTIL